MFKKKIVFAVLLGAGFLFTLTPALAAVKTYQNDLPQSSWVKYGVNPWVLDTDNDGYTDAWEVKTGYCPTNYNKGVTLNAKDCYKGKVDLKNKIYTAPVAIQDNLPREIKKVKSCADLQTVLKKQYQDSRSKYDLGTSGSSNSIDLGLEFAAPTGLGASEAPAKASYLESTDYSSTNIQVEGVDEADLVKTDGKYIYSLSFNTAKEVFLAITQAVPANKAEVVGKVQIKDGFVPEGFYLSGDYLLAVGSTGFDSLSSGYSSRAATVAQIFNIRDKSKPFLARTVLLDGTLLGSRVIGNYAYLVLYYSGYNVMGWDGKVNTTNLLPKYKDAKGTIAQARALKAKDLSTCSNVVYLTPTESYDYLEIVALPLNSTGKINSKIVVGTDGSQIYVSPTNLYVATRRSGYQSWWKKEVTDIQKFSLKNGAIDMVATQVVPGTTLNQFSFDEQNGNLRLVTTEGQNWGWSRSGSTQRNDLYILDKNLNRIGWYENFGENEKIYSARFMGNRAYVVTFKETDPMFVFDLKDPRQPKLLGELSMPGYSTYLHPYDETHLIGIGKQATSNSSTPGFAWYQGLKIGLFDVSDPSSPKEMSSREIGDRGSSSEALYDHHAFLFSKAKKLLAFPVEISQLTAEQKKSFSSSAYGENTFSGLYVYNVDLTNGFSFLGGITPDRLVIDGDSMNDQIYRSLYIGDYLYAVSLGQITVHKLSDLDVVKQVNLLEKTTKVNTTAKDAKKLSDLKQLQTALELYYIDQGQYPTGNSVTLGSTNYACINASGWAATGCTNAYMGMVPKDSGSSAYVYTMLNSGKSYQIKAHLEGGFNGLSGDITLTPSGIAD